MQIKDLYSYRKSIFNIFNVYFFVICFQKQIRKTEEVKTKITLDESTLGSVIKLVRDCNVTLHWILLHTAIPTFLLEDAKKSRSLRQMVIQESKYSANNGLRLLLSTAQIEHEVKQLYKQVRIS